MTIDQSVQYYWNSLTRFNKPVKIIGVNDENYAVEADGHVFVVPKANISPIKKVIVPPVPPVTTAPKPDEPYWFTLTVEEWNRLAQDLNKPYMLGTVWNDATRELMSKKHSGSYTNEWFSVSTRTAEDLLILYKYDMYKHEIYIDKRLPIGLLLKSVVRQLWEEKLRRDGIVPK